MKLLFEAQFRHTFKGKKTGEFLLARSVFLKLQKASAVLRTLLIANEWHCIDHEDQLNSCCYQLQNEQSLLHHSPDL